MELQELLKQGFDKSYANWKGKLVVRCSYCEAHIKKGTPVHDKACTRPQPEVASCTN